MLSQAWPSGDASPSAGTTVPGEVRRVPGGVARNIAAVLAALPCGADEALLPSPLLVSAVGDDADGAALLAHMRCVLPAPALHSTLTRAYSLRPQ